MPINTEKFKAFTESFGLAIDFSDGQVLLTSMKEFLNKEHKRLTDDEKQAVKKAYRILKRKANKIFDDFWKEQSKDDDHKQPSEEDALLEAAKQGKTVVANIRSHKQLIKWAEENSKLVYIGRQNKKFGQQASKWQNPFKLTIDTKEKREEVCDKYEKRLLDDKGLMNDLQELDGKVLMCFCAPKGCHGHSLVKLREAQKKGC